MSYCPGVDTVIGEMESRFDMDDQSVLCALASFIFRWGKPPSPSNLKYLLLLKEISHSDEVYTTGTGTLNFILILQKRK